MTNPIDTYYYGFTQVTNAHMLGVGVMSSDSSASGNLTTPGSGRVIFPGSGYRTNSNGSLTYQGYFGYYWSATPASATYGYYLSIAGSGAIPLASNSRAHGYSVRCILTD